jgi:5-aminolevulinate synthase
MSNLQSIARRCPIMGKALAIQTAKHGKLGFAGLGSVAAIRAISGKVSTGKAKLHTTTSNNATAVEGIIINKGPFASGQYHNECVVILRDN